MHLCYCCFFVDRLLALEDVNLWKSGSMTLSTTSGSAVKVVMEVWMNWRLEIFPFIEYCAGQECPCCMIYIKQFCSTGFFPMTCNFLLLSYCLVGVHGTLSRINQNLPWSSCFCNKFLFSSSTVHVYHFLIFRKLGSVFFTMFVGNTNGLEEPASIPLMKQEPQERRIWQSLRKLYQRSGRLSWIRSGLTTWSFMFGSGQ